MKRSILIFITVLITACGVSGVYAQEAVSPERAALIREFVEASGGKEEFNEIIDNSMASQQEGFKQMSERLFNDDQRLTAADKVVVMKMVQESMDRLNLKAKEFFATKFDFNKFVADVYVPVIAKHFSDADLRDLIAFYRSPVGQKLIREQPALMADSQAAVAKHFLPEFVDYMKKAVDDETASIAKKMSKGLTSKGN